MKKLLLILLIISIKITFSQSYYNYSSDLIRLNPFIETSDFNYILNSPTSITTSYSFTLPNGLGTNGQFLQTNGNGVTSWTTLSLGSANPGGSDRQLQYNDNGSFAGSSNFVWEADNQLAVGQSSANYDLDVNGNLQSGIEGTDGEVRIYSEQGGTDYQVVFRPNAAMTQSTTYTWPAEDGPDGDILVTDGNGNLYWTTDGVTGSFPCNGQGTGGGSGNEANGDNGFVGGGSSNEITGQASNAFIGGGVDNEVEGDRSAITGGTNNNTGPSADQSTIGSGDNNQILGDDSIIGAGTNNFIDGNNDPGNNGQGNDGQNFIGAGSDNSIYSTNSAIMAGFGNEILNDNSTESFIGAGFSNLIDNSERSGIMAGRDNEIDDGDRSAISSGQNNSITDNDSFIGAGLDNTISNNEAVIAGGRNNEVTRENSLILGGRDNSILTAGGSNFAFAFGRDVEISGEFGIGIGRRAIVNDNGAAAFADANDQDLTTSSTDRMEMRFSNGYIFYTNDGFTTGLRLQPGANSWSALSDVTKKENIIKTNDDEVLNKLLKIKISSWNYKSINDISNRNYGPMAQDFFALFGTDQFGSFASDTTIIPMHLTSLGLSATKALLNNLEEQEQEIKLLSKEQTDLEDEIYALEKKIIELERRLASQ
jgi:hypothetical protein